MADKSKNFNFKLYGIVTFITVAALLAAICVTTFKSRYTAFHPEKLVETYVDTIIQKGDGYNAYKNTLASVNYKYGDFIREYYINPAIFRDDEKGYNDESFKSEKTLTDDGSLQGQLIEKMYPVYENLVKEYGWDDYDSIYSIYINELIKVREEIFGDKFFNDEVFFSAFEANVTEYGNNLTGTDDVFDENTGVQLSHKTEGLYEKEFGKDYKFLIDVISENTIDLNDYKNEVDMNALDTYGVSIDEITDVKSLGVAVYTIDNESYSGTTVAQLDVVIVKIGSSWYVDNTMTDTSALYI